jgi:EF hand
MNRSMAAFAAALAMTVQGCSMLGGSDKPAAVPAAAAETPASGQAAPPRQPEMMRLSRFDSNTDGMVQRAELEETLKGDFKTEDANGNEVLDPAEARIVNERLRDEPGSSPVFDWNGDGRLVYAEFATQWRTLFDRTDRNGDGIVDGDEIKTSGRERKPRALPQPTFSGKDGRPPGSPN